MPAKDPEVGSGPVSSGCGMAGVIVIEVALVVAHVSVVLCPVLTYVGFAVNCVTVGKAEPTTCYGRGLGCARAMGTFRSRSIGRCLRGRIGNAASSLRAGSHCSGR